MLHKRVKAVVFPKASASLATRLATLQDTAEKLHLDAHDQVQNLTAAAAEIGRQIGQAAQVKAQASAIRKIQ